MFGETQDTEKKERDGKRKYTEFPPRKSQKGKVISILKTRLVVEIKGNGVSVDFDPKLHDGVKVGDEIDIT